MILRVGKRLREQRIKKGLTIEDAAKATKIKPSFLAALEEGAYEKLPASTYAQGFIRNYAEFLDLPVTEILALFRREFNEEKNYKVLPQGLSTEEEFSVKRFKIKDTFKVIIFAFFILLLYILFQYRHAFINPKLEVIFPQEGSVVSSNYITVSGKTDSNTTVFINDEAAALDNSGRFSKIITSFAGENTITIKAVNNFGKQTVIQRHIEVK